MVPCVLFTLISPGAAPVLSEIPAPIPAPGELCLRIGACGLNFADLLMISGDYQDTPPAPFTLGMEVAGVVESLGEPLPAQGTADAAPRPCPPSAAASRSSAVRAGWPNRAAFPPTAPSSFPIP